MHPRRAPKVIAYGLGAVLAAGVGCSGALIIAKQFSTAATPLPTRLEVADDELDLGERLESASHEHRFHLENPTDSPVCVTGLSGTCDCQGWAPAVPFTVPAHGRQKVWVRLTLPTNSECGRGQGGESVVMPVKVTFTGPSGASQSQEWELRCVLRPALWTRGVLALGMQTADQLTAGREIELTAVEHVAALGCQGPAHWAVTIRRVPGGAPKFTAALRYVGPPAPAVIDDTLVFTPTDARGQSLPAARVRITGELVEDVIASPRSAYFGRYVVGSVAEDVVFLKSQSGKPFTVRRAIPRMLGCTVVPLGDGPTGTSWLIRQTISAVGQQSGEAEFAVEDGTGVITRVVVPVTYLGFNE
jgi:hypothetical protein